MGQVSIFGWGVLDLNSAKLLLSLKRRQRALPISVLRGHSEDLIPPVPPQQISSVNSSSSNEQKAMMLPLQTTYWVYESFRDWNDSFLGTQNHRISGVGRHPPESSKSSPWIWSLLTISKTFSLLCHQCHWLGRMIPNKICFLQNIWLSQNKPHWKLNAFSFRLRPENFWLWFFLNFPA